MADNADDLEKLLVDVRKTISDNKQFLEKLADETVEDVQVEGVEVIVFEDEFEEL